MSFASHVRRRCLPLKVQGKTDYFALRNGQQAVEWSAVPAACVRHSAAPLLCPRRNADNSEVHVTLPLPASSLFLHRFLEVSKGASIGWTLHHPPIRGSVGRPGPVTQPLVELGRRQTPPEFNVLLRFSPKSHWYRPEEPLHHNSPFQLVEGTRFISPLRCTFIGARWPLQRQRPFAKYAIQVDACRDVFELPTSPDSSMFHRIEYCHYSGF